VSRAKLNKFGYRCPVRGCNQRKNRAFLTVMGVVKHMLAQHGEEELVKRLRVKKS